MALCSCLDVIRKVLATSALVVASSNRCFSSAQNIAAASTWTGDRSSHFRNASSVEVGRIFVLQYFTISNLPTIVVAGFGGGGGVERGKTTPGGRTNCNVGGTAAAKTSVNSSGADLQTFLEYC